MKGDNNWFMDEYLVLNAKEKAMEIIDSINYDGSGMVDTNKIIVYISNQNIDITAYEADFSTIKRIENYGAMMSVHIQEDNKKICKIYLNNKCDPIFKRFSLAHEIGHLFLEDYIPGKLIVSTHINYSLTKLPPKTCEANEFFKKEELANIFALELLMPSKYFIKTLNNTKSFKETANFFGVTLDAVSSKMFLLSNYL